jgi:hypothetical protein
LWILPRHLNPANGSLPFCTKHNANSSRAPFLPLIHFKLPTLVTFDFFVLHPFFTASTLGPPYLHRGELLQTPLRERVRDVHKLPLNLQLVVKTALRHICEEIGCIVCERQRNFTRPAKNAGKDDNLLYLLALLCRSSSKSS